MEEVLTAPAGTIACQEIRIRSETVLDVAAVDARAADTRTGRGVTTAHATVAATLGCSPKTVQRARSVIERLGFAITAERGRYLSGAERAAARAQHGGNQRRMASVRHLLMPRPVTNVHLPRRGSITYHPQSCNEVPKRPHAGARRTQQQQKPTNKARGRPQRPSIGVQRLAAALAYRLPWLAHGHIGSLCHTLMALGLDDTGWSAQDIITMLDDRNTHLGLYSIPVSSQRDPLALFAHQVRIALLDVDEPPRQRRAREAAASKADQAAAAAAREAQRACLDAQRSDPLAQARIADAKASIRAHLAAAKTG